MKDFGGASATCLKNSIDSAFDKFEMSKDKYIKCMVPACADGASVNMGKKTGALHTYET